MACWPRGARPVSYTHLDVYKRQQLGEAVALRVYSPMFLGLTGDEWSGIFWAGLLLVITVACLYAAVCADSQKDDYVCD